MELPRLYPAQKNVLESAINCKETSYDVVKKIRILLYCWEHRNDEMCATNAAKVFNVSVSSIYRYLEIYRKFGFRKFMEGKKKRDDIHPVFNDIDKISELIESVLPKSQKEVKSLIEEKFGYSVSLKTLRKLLKKLVVKKRKPKIIPGKADPAKQEQFLAQTLQPAIEDSKEGKCILLFGDAAHVNNGGDSQAVYSKERVAIPSSAGRESASIVGAVDPVNDKYVMMPVEGNVNKEVMMTFLRKIRYQYGSKEIKIRLVLDNARYQKSKNVLELSKKLNIELVYLPPYSPNLNLIERVWKLMRTTAIRNKFLKGKKELMEVLKEFALNCNNNAVTRVALKSILTFNFESIAKYM